MNVSLTTRFQSDVQNLSQVQQDKVFQIILSLPKVVKSHRLHSGVGLRKIHSSGIFEARIGLGLRMVFSYRSDELVLERVGNHDEVRKYLKNL